MKTHWHTALRTYFPITISALVVSLCAAELKAIPFDSSPTGGTVTIGSGGGTDYASLAAAAIAFNGVAGGINGPWTILITSDLTEPANIPFANNIATTASVLF